MGLEPGRDVVRVAAPPTDGSLEQSSCSSGEIKCPSSPYHLPRATLIHCPPIWLEELLAGDDVP